MEYGKTIAELAAENGRIADTLWRRAKRMFPAEAWSINSVPTEEQAEALLGGGSVKPSKRVPATVRDFRTVASVAQVDGGSEEPSVESAKAAHYAPRAKSATKHADKTNQLPRWRTAVLVALLVAPTAASVHNMHSVTSQLAKTPADAVFMTIVLSVSALGFIGVGVRRGWSLPLAILLIAFESFCNLASIYGGLMNAGTINYGLPTPFLGLVTDIFNSGTHWTAIFLAAFTAFFIAAVQYAAVFELNKK